MLDIELLLKKFQTANDLRARQNSRHMDSTNANFKYSLPSLIDICIAHKPIDRTPRSHCVGLTRICLKRTSAVVVAASGRYLEKSAPLTPWHLRLTPHAHEASGRKFSQRANVQSAVQAWTMRARREEAAELEVVTAAQPRLRSSTVFRDRTRGRCLARLEGGQTLAARAGAALAEVEATPDVGRATHPVGDREVPREMVRPRRTRMQCQLIVGEGAAAAAARGVRCPRGQAGTLPRRTLPRCPTAREHRTAVEGVDRDPVGQEQHRLIASDPRRRHAGEDLPQRQRQRHRLRVHRQTRPGFSVSRERRGAATLRDPGFHLGLGENTFTHRQVVAAG